MCVIAASPAGIPQPTETTIRAMFTHNPHGAGYMFARDGKVTIHKGFMDCRSFLRSIATDKLTSADPVVYHCRIATQGARDATMTHPFPLSANLRTLKASDLTCPIGAAHNGIIRLTSTIDDKATGYSDTALFISRYLTRLIRNRKDVDNPDILSMIEELTDSRWAFLTGDGAIITVGDWIDDDGILYSNTSYRSGFTFRTVKPAQPSLLDLQDTM